jgi:hypothetical protein
VFGDDLVLQQRGLDHLAVDAFPVRGELHVLGADRHARRGGRQPGNQCAGSTLMAGEPSRWATCTDAGAS